MSRQIETFACQQYEIPEELAIVDNIPLDNLSDDELKEAMDHLRLIGYKGDLRHRRSRGVFRILSSKDGDKRVTWRRTVLAEISAAKRMFLDLIKQGMVPYSVGLNGKAVSEMKEFDPVAEEIIFMPLRAISGG